MNLFRYLRKAILFTAIAVILSSCVSGPYVDPAAAGLSQNQQAILEHPDPAHSHIIITYVDGKYRGLGIKDRYVLSPGKHVIRASAGVLAQPQPGKEPDRALTTGGYYDLEFTAKAGKAYVIGAEFSQAEMKYTSYIKEKSTGQIVSELKPVP